VGSIPLGRAPIRRVDQDAGQRREDRHGGIGILIRQPRHGGGSQPWGDLTPQQDGSLETTRRRKIWSMSQLLNQGYGCHLVDSL